MKRTIIVAQGRNREIGRDNDLLWRLPADMKLFRKHTMGHCIIMGRKTYQSIGKPLKDRTMIVLSRQPGFKAPGCVVMPSMHAALDYSRRQGEIEVFIIGGATIYEKALATNRVDRIPLTQVHADFPDADTHFPPLDPTH